MRFSIRSKATPALAVGALGQFVEVPIEGEGVILGRALAVGVELPFPRVSGRHARLMQKEDGIWVEDLGSVNGTWIGKRRLLPHVAEPIRAGDTLLLADVQLFYLGETVREGEIPDTESTATLARRLVGELFDACSPSEVARLVVLDGPAENQQMALDVRNRAYVLGRGGTCDLVVPDDVASREHLTVERRADGILVRDLGSKNGVVFAGQKMLGLCRLQDGDILRVGDTHLRLFDPEDRYLRQIQAAEAPSAMDAPGHSTPVPALPRSARAGGLLGPHMPVVVTVIACTVLLGVFGMGLALVLGSWK